MTTDPKTGDPSVEQIEADIARTREELAQTVDQLAAKLDVKSRVRDRVTSPDGKPTPAVTSVGAGVIAGLAAMVVIWLWGRR
jgi:hypothetical protein